MVRYKKILPALLVAVFVLVSLFSFTNSASALPNSCRNAGMYEAQLNISPSSGSVDQTVNVEARFRWTTLASSDCTSAGLLFSVYTYDSSGWTTSTVKILDKLAVGASKGGQWVTKSSTITPSTLSSSLIPNDTQIKFDFWVEEQGGVFANENIVHLEKFFTVSTDPGICNNNGTCEPPDETSFTCPSDCKGKPGEDQTFIFKLDNPLEADNLLELIDVLATWLFNLSVPIVVVMIVYAGVMFLTSRGDTTKVTKARQILLYAVVGFAIILIGKGFITLIESILNLGATP